MSIDVIFALGTRDLELEPAPIESGWILGGNPTARGRILSRSADDTAWTAIWECTAGQFNWFYGIDETVYVIDGSVTITAPGAPPRRVGAGDSIFFPSGSSAHWNVEDHVRKIAFLRKPMPRQIQQLRRIHRSIKRWIGRGERNDSPNRPMLS